MKKEMFVCKYCGSPRVQEKAWVDLNSVNPEIDFLLSGDTEDYWCKECLDHTNVILKIDYDNNRKD